MFPSLVTPAEHFSDLGQLSNQSTPPANPSVGSSKTTLSRPTTQPLLTIPANTAPTPVLITNSISASPIRASTQPAVQLGPDAITTTPPLIRPPTTARSTPGVNGPLTVVAEPVRRSLGKRAEEVKPTSGVIGLSSVPTSTGGAMYVSYSGKQTERWLIFRFVSMSRIIMGLCHS